MTSSIVGILNITPDSFSDGGLYDDAIPALERAKEMSKSGAAVIDVGAESTRPGAKTIPADEEWRRLEPVLKAMNDSKIDSWISLDTRNHETVQKAMHIGIDWVNDVSGLSSPKMIDVVAKSALKIVLMHNMGIPADPNITIKKELDPVKEIITWAKEKIDYLEKKGISKNRIIFDPGIGFGKTAEQSFQIINEIDRLKEIGTMILVGHSRKSFLKIFTDKDASSRDRETSIISQYLSSKDVDYLRVHDVKQTKEEIEKNNADGYKELTKNLSS